MCVCGRIGDPICLFCPLDVSESRLKDLAWLGVAKAKTSTLRPSTFIVDEEVQETNLIFFFIPYNFLLVLFGQKYQIRRSEWLGLKRKKYDG